MSISIRIENHIAYVALDRADKRNAISFDMLKQLLKAAKSIRANRDVRAIIIHGNGSSFSSGIDLSDLNNTSNRLFAAWQLIKPGQSLFQKAFLTWQKIPVPVIAVMHGHCLGAGMQLALAADIRISSADCQCAIMEARWGLVPDMGITQTLKGLVPIDIAKELTFSARVISGETAHTLGLVTHISDTPLEAATTLANEFINRSPDSLAASKRVLNAMVFNSKRSAIRLEKISQLKLVMGKNSTLARKKDKNPDVEFINRQR
ncbi:crotonase/enoyl-CoA hydratase family protein [uncultured Cocleimonas sp.]|uniref:crotonase/enoyl-CoA hydratase family protein n=1 Tax=uncultured Cocleimonas sp. TaxID=1051587 RepID=UPI00262D1F61|nr:crotonase/enoyl-CoA hydratase family protein [uncultured Cocleimonas sp.]